MAGITPLVFVTGATGFIGSHVVTTTLRAGYRVRLSIRKAEQEATLRELFPGYDYKIETCIVPDISQQESFKEALQGVDYVFHLASPTPGKGDDFKQDYVDPAVKGTEAILYAVLEFPQIKKVTVVSSVLALAPVGFLIAKDLVLADNTGEVIPVDISMQFPEGFAGHALKYAASKVLAHQATRSFLKDNQPHYTLINFHPTFVLGHSLIQKTAEQISGMNALFWLSVKSGKTRISNAWVHVSDVADAHVKALGTDIKSGTEFILSRPSVSWDHVADFIKTKYPAADCKLEPPFEGNWKLDTTAADTILKMHWRSEETIIEDVVEQQLDLIANVPN
ncbi:NAD(P)-binding protein [Aspergillus sclerotioniger CBS 115572]|uniref:NAD(P)-binding protein n=1 Tax=Aspergillus sclerotioniger CBS 115572 TaxID=1450535 RepID=A0A317WD53_9EURO|nr:NAD(P)-binding protein [Aspergillus sclerotioniger CBS 115572]PWY83855.1 NAD(P)-binding protein [Aspergillus sclerotioniger CBS 115572]